MSNPLPSDLAAALTTWTDSQEQSHSDTEPEVPRVSISEIMHKKYLPEGYTPKSAAQMSFDPKLVMELAMELDSPSVVFARYGYTPEEMAALIGNKHFITALKDMMDQVKKDGLSFKMKAKMQAEDLLQQSYSMATNPDTPAAVRADIIKWTAKMADLEPKSTDGKSMGQGFQLNITFAGAPQAVQVDATKVIEGETE